MRTLNKATLSKIESYIQEYQKENGLSPSYRNIMHEVNMSSLSLVQRYVIELEKTGRIKRTNLGNIAVPTRLRTGETTTAPLVGKVACGQPSFAVESIIGSFSLPRDIFGSGDLFLLKAFGDSMIEIGIDEGDLLVLRKQNYAEDGDIVVALVGDDTTLKRLYRRGKQIVLHPENKNLKDIVVDNCQIQGVLVSCIKRY